MPTVGYVLQKSGQICALEQNAIAIWDGIKQTEIQPVAFCPEYGQLTVILSHRTDIPFYVYPYIQPSFSAPFKTIRQIFEWNSLFKQAGIGLLHANDMFCARSVMLPACLRGIPVLCDVRYQQDVSTLLWLFRHLPKPAGFIFCSHALQEQCAEIIQSACPKADLFVVPNAVNIDDFAYVPKTGNARLRIGIIGSFVLAKGHEDFLDMADLLLKKGYNVQFDIIGDDIYNQGRRSFLEKKALILNLSGHCVFHGYVRDIAEMIQQLDIVVCTSHTEPFARSLIEGMSCGKPVVSTNVDGIPEIVRDRETGFLVNPHAPRELAGCVEQLIRDPELRYRMGEQGRADVTERFSLRSQADALISIYSRYCRIQ
ncbi:MAG: glycosyltransferase family 4 protein [Candidatus Auribacterota bacterium]